MGDGGRGRGLRELNRTVTEDGPTKGRPRIDSDIDAAETILYLAPETNGEVAVKGWEALGEKTGRDHTHLAKQREDEKIRFRDIAPSPARSSPRTPGPASKARSRPTMPAI